jgi:hypothetical protein
MLYLALKKKVLVIPLYLKTLKHVRFENPLSYNELEYDYQAKRITDIMLGIKSTTLRVISTLFPLVGGFTSAGGCSFFACSWRCGPPRSRT